MYSKNADKFASIPALNNGGDALVLKDGSGTIIDAVAWEGGASSGIPTGWGSTSNPSSATGSSIVRADIFVDTDSFSDWTTASGNGNPNTQSDGAVSSEALPEGEELFTEELPTEVALGNYPNPFNPSTNIHFTLTESNNVRLTVYNMIGQEVAVLVNGFKNAGKHDVTFDATNLSTGVYIYRLVSGGQVKVQKMLLTK
ncbi:MAG: T9SS type A sorting domain-containing protein [Balneola sp.]|nr:T9SS type A sorting domain-containing protein [Balneola sp.]